MKTYKIAVLPGDGIGPEITAEAVKALQAIFPSVEAVGLDLEHYEVGAGLYQRTGEALPEEVFLACKEADAILLGACGLPAVRRPDGTEAATVPLDLRFRLDLYAGIRPIKLYPKVRSPLILKENQTIDYVIVRENTEGLYASRNGGIIQRDQVAVDLSVFTREGVERIVRTAFRLAERRMNGPQGRVPMVTCVDKSNVTPGYAFFRKVFREVAQYWPHVEKDYAYIDAFTLYQVTMPECYDVVVAENMFGDIISDLGAATVGGLGMAPSADVGDRHGLFQSAHGSAPSLAGRNIANPLAAILSAGMMLQWLGERAGDEAVCRAAERIDRAVSDVLIKNEIRTQDIGGSSKTTEVGDAVADRIANM